MGVKYYDAKDVSIIYGGMPIKGFADGTFVAIEQESDDWGDVVGSDGEVARYPTNDRRTTIRFTLLQTSNSNDRLSRMSNLDLRLPNGGGVAAVLVRDGNGRSIYEAPAAWVQRPPNAEFGREVGSREWAIRVGRVNRFDGGN